MPKSLSNIQAKVIVKGRVQGVFFRRTVLEHSKGFAITGYVKNLESNQVEIVVQGEKEEIERFIKKIKSDPKKAFIESIDIHYENKNESFDSFVIHY